MSERGQLLRILGLGFGIAAVIGGMVGQGILRTPGIVAAGAGSGWLMVSLWLVGGLIVALSALAYVELGCAMPRAGGCYEYASRAFGPLVGGITGLSDWLNLVVAMAMFPVVIGEFSARLGIGPWGPAIPMLVLFLVWAINWSGTRVSGTSQIIFSAIKGAALLLLIALLFLHRGPAADAPSQTTQLVAAGGLVAAMQVIISTYNGWQNFAYYTEELTSPGKTIPRAMFSGVAGVTILYVLVNVALLKVLTPAAIARSTLPAADATAILFGSAGAVILTGFGILSVFAVANITTMAATRLGFALARGGMLPRAMAGVAASGTPRTALTAGTVIAAGLVLSGSYLTLVALSVALSMLPVVVTLASALKLRRHEPELERPYRVPFHPAPVVLALAVNAALLAALIVGDPVHSLEGLAMAVVGGVALHALGRRGRWSGTAAELA